VDIVLDIGERFGNSPRRSGLLGDFGQNGMRCSEAVDKGQIPIILICQTYSE
jgi:hypothetical protein